MINRIGCATLLGLCLASGLLAQDAAPEEPPAPQISGWFELRPATPGGKTPFAVQGWAVATCGDVEVVVRVNGREVIRGSPSFAWPGVAEKYPEMPGAGQAGFRTQIDPTRFDIGEHRLALVVEGCGLVQDLGTATFRTVPPTPSWIAWPLLALLLVGFPFAGARWLARRETVTGTVPALELRVALLLAMLIATIVAARHVGESVIQVGDGLFAPLANWDGRYYLTLARDDYSGEHPEAYAFFPLYPAVLRLLALLPLPLSLSGSLLNAGLILLLTVILRRLYPGEDRGILIFLCLPFAFFFVATYTEPLALVLAAGFLLALRRERPGWAFGLGVLAGLTRISSISLVLFALDFLRRRRWKLSAISVAAPVTGLALWMVWLGRTTGDPLRFIHVQEEFGRSISFDGGRLFDLLRTSAASADAQSRWELFFLVLVLVGAAVLVLKGRWGEGGYSALAVLLPLATVRLTSLNRYALAAFPVFVLLGGLLPRRIAFRVVLGLELLFLFYYTVRFGLQYWVG